VTGGARRGRGGGGRNRHALRAGDAGGGARLRRLLGPKRGAPRGRAGPRHRRPTARGGERGVGARRHGGAAGPKGEEREGREKKKIFLFLISIVYMNAFTLPNNQ
jgi:hypothetical protein